MKELSVDLKNCYGITKLEYDFDFTNENGCLIYASNGTMKTSFAKTFLDISQGNEPKDNIFRGPAEWDIKITDISLNESPIKKEEIFVIESFYDEINFADNISKLLVNKNLRIRFDNIYSDIKSNKQRILAKIAKISGLTKLEVEKKFLKDFAEKEDFLDLLLSIKNDIDGQVEIPVKEISYSVIFDDKVVKFINENIDLIENYSNKYNELIENSAIFKKNVFTHNNAVDVGKQLKTSGFFDAEHKVSLSNGKIITQQKDLESVIQNEKTKILSQDELKEWFNEIDSHLDKNKTLKGFKSTLGNHPEIIPEFHNIPQFKKKMWISILNTEKEAICNLINIYKDGKEEIEEIRTEALNEEAEWKRVVKLFNERFDVPFEIEVSNQDDVILKNEMPSVNFKFKENTEREKYLAQKDLEEALSAGERRALYLLNILYEIEIRKKQERTTLIIADDIADSFDYQNKYAIIEYLNDILLNNTFRIIILTHNFDFYRTVGSRLDITRDNCNMVLKKENDVEIVRGQYLKNIFNQWKTQLNRSNRVLIATIPFVRNLVEYIQGKNVENYALLTNLLHLKDDTKSIYKSQLKSVYSEVWGADFDIDDDFLVFDTLMEEADSIILETTENVNLERKIVLSIAIRLLAEEYMFSKLDSEENISFDSYQTRRLYEKYKDENGDDPLIKNLEQVNLMTPENIHLNSFMYEPILDMSDDHLKRLYTIIKGANEVSVTGSIFGA